MVTKAESLLIVYALLGILTFGAAYNIDYEPSISKFSTNEEENSVRAAVSGLLWPLYWTTKAFTSLRPKEYR